ncbi:hypothetical protein BIW11_01804 [Tropilaelaps mercedesae]|uniref:Uncharacterized protein n=1 Tax=Tropilaelaps mercedesae TaxID=418985 RepID=A0A1V9X8G7_9ACAR|nr:hypothetical protein BIW11_01804 [Tropilaelaps mercedesae]
MPMQVLQRTLLPSGDVVTKSFEEPRQTVADFCLIVRSTKIQTKPRPSDRGRRSSRATVWTLMSELEQRESERNDENTDELFSGLDLWGRRHIFHIDLPAYLCTPAAHRADFVQFNQPVTQCQEAQIGQPEDKQSPAKTDQSIDECLFLFSPTTGCQSDPSGSMDGSYDFDGCNILIRSHVDGNSSPFLKCLQATSFCGQLDIGRCPGKLEKFENNGARCRDEVDKGGKPGSRKTREEDREKETVDG